MVPFAIHPLQWNAWEGQGDDHMEGNEGKTNYWQSPLFHSEWVELGY